MTMNKAEIYTMLGFKGCAGEARELSKPKRKVEGSEEQAETFVTESKPKAKRRARK